MKRILFVLTVLVLTVLGCAQKKVVAPEAEQPQVMRPVIEEKKGSEIARPTERIKEEEQAKVESKEIPSKEILSKVEEVAGTIQDIHFDFDKYDIREDAKPILKAVADYLIKNNNHKILIEGHCDERGTNEYNLALGDKRARAAKEYLISLGVSSNRIDVISYGEEKPLCSEHTEECWAKNRRAHFIIIKEKK